MLHQNLFKLICSDSGDTQETDKLLYFHSTGDTPKSLDCNSRY